MELEFDGAELELWVAPHQPGVRKRRLGFDMTMTDQQLTLAVSECELFYWKGNIKMHHVAPKQACDFQIGNSSSVVATTLRESMDLPAYAAFGLPTLFGDLQFFIDDAAAVRVESVPNVGIHVSYPEAGPFPATVTLDFTTELAIKKAQLWLGDRLCVECIVSKHQRLENLLVPSQYTYSRFGADGESIVETGTRILQSAELDLTEPKEIFSQHLPPGSVILEDQSPRELKQVNESGRMVTK